MNSKDYRNSQLNPALCGTGRTSRTDRKGESGSVIWFILLAVILLGALTISISRSSDSVEQSGDRERARVIASDIMRYAKGLEQAISKMRMSGISENAISFENSFVSGYENARCTTTSCRLFHEEGGGLLYREPETMWLDGGYNGETFYGELVFTSNPCIPNVGNYGEGANCAADLSNVELMMIIPFIKESICLEVNRMVDLGTGGAAPPQDDQTAWSATESDVRFTGLFNNGFNLESASSDLEGFTTGCFQGDTRPAGGYHFFYTLLPRPGG